MKVLLICLALLLLESNADLTVEVNGIPNTKGTIFIGLFDKAANFPTFGKQLKGVVLKIDGKQVSHNFKNLPAGKYAIAVYHDENKNGKLDKNLFGAPTEFYGFSNNVREMFSAPSFQDASVLLNADQKIQIWLK
ncbi:MAG: hypothetical protein RLZZ65_1289 [Bacteroidota bacterium]|jgi:uncharacterized protein (DUF2141 family)